MPTPQSQDISNCLSAAFDTVNGTSPGSWSLCYNSNQNTLSLSATVTTPDSVLEPAPKLVSTIDTKGLSDMITFIYQVNLQMQKKVKNSNSAGNNG